MVVPPLKLQEEQRENRENGYTLASLNVCVWDRWDVQIGDGAGEEDINLTPPLCLSCDARESVPENLVGGCRIPCVDKIEQWVCACEQPLQALGIFFVSEDDQVDVLTYKQDIYSVAVVVEY